MVNKKNTGINMMKLFHKSSSIGLAPFVNKPEEVLFSYGVEWGVKTGLVKQI
jgi:hypothetical protein